MEGRTETMRRERKEGREGREEIENSTWRVLEIVKPREDKIKEHIPEMDFHVEER